MSDSSSSGPGGPDNGERRDSEEADPNSPTRGQQRPQYGEMPYGQPQEPQGQDQYGQGQYGQGQHGQGHESGPPDQSGYGYQQGGYQGYQQGGYYGGYQTVPDHPRSTMALTLGLIGLVGTLLCVVPSVVGPFAWYVGAKAKREIDTSGGRLGGRGQAVTGYVLGIITTVLLVLIILALGALIAFAVTVGFEDPDRLQY